MIVRISEFKVLTKNVLWECKCRFDGKKCNSDQWRNNDKSQSECNKRHVCQKDYIWNHSICNCENAKY